MGICGVHIQFGSCRSSSAASRAFSRRCRCRGIPVTMVSNIDPPLKLMTESMKKIIPRNLLGRVFVVYPEFIFKEKSLPSVLVNLPANIKRLWVTGCNSESLVDAYQRGSNTLWSCGKVLRSASPAAEAAGKSTKFNCFWRVKLAHSPEV